MKTKNLDYQTVAHYWIHNSEGIKSAFSKGERLYFCGGAIYIVIIAALLLQKKLPRLDGQNSIIMFTKDTYSNTTAKHKKIVLEAMPSYYSKIFVNKILSDGCDWWNLFRQVQHEREYLENNFFKYHFKEFSKMRDNTKGKIEKLHFLETQISDFQKLIDYVSQFLKVEIEINTEEKEYIRRSEKVILKPAFRFVEKYKKLLEQAKSKDYAKKIELIQKKEEKKRQKAREKQLQETITKFYDLKGNKDSQDYWYGNLCFGKDSKGFTRLVLLENTVLSSQHRYIAIEDFLKFYKLWKIGKSQGCTFENIEFKFCDEKQIILGCHNFSNDEIERIYNEIQENIINN